MKPRGLLFIALAILVVTALSAAVATAQNGVQETQSGALGMPIDVTGSSPTNINADFDTGNKQINTYMPGETKTNSSKQTAEPRRKQPREGNNKDGATPTEAAPSGGNPTNPGGSGLSSYSGSPLTELPRTGGPENTGP